MKIANKFVTPSVMLLYGELSFVKIASSFVMQLANIFVICKGGSCFVNRNRICNNMGGVHVL